jgi:RHS repeat-associated protein
MHYDPLGRLIQTDFPDLTVSKVLYSPWQQLNYDQNDCNETSPHYDTPQIIDFDVLGRPFQTTDDNGAHGLVITHNKLDITGRMVAVTDALGRVATKNIYAFSEEHLLYTHNIDSGKRWILNDTAGKPVKKWDEREYEFSYYYDALQRLTETKINDAYVECLIYGEDDQENNIGQVIVSYAQDGITFFEYDFKGNIIFLRKQFTQDYNMLINWEDDLELLEEVFSTETSYDALNRPVSIKHPDDTVVSYVYDKGGLLQKVLQNNAEHITNITYNPKGQRENIYYGNNTKTRYYYNPLNFRLIRLLSTRNTGQDILQDLNYDYDAAGNITKITDNAQQTHYFNNSVIAPVATFEYDALYRLTKATGRELTALAAPDENDFANNIPCPNTASNAMQNYTHNYYYDKLGNMLSDAWKTYEYATVNNYLLGHDSVTDQYTHDAHGNMLSMPHLSEMIWDYDDRLFAASNGTFTSFYNYDAEGSRTRKVVVKNNIREERYYISGYEVYRKYNANVLDFERSTVNITDDEKVFVRVETEIGQGEVVRYQYDNHLGSACLELDEDGLIISYEEYHPFGTTSYRAGRSDVEVSLKKYRFCGKERDEETGLYNFGARLYAPWLCRFISCDPKIADYPQVNPYCYCLNNPINYIDPDGRDVWEVNDEGRIINRIEDKTQDAFYMVAKDADGNYQRTSTTDAEGNTTYNSISFEYGTVTAVRTPTINLQDKDGNVTPTKLTTFEMKGDDNATQLFEFLANPETTTNVEWSHAKVGTESSGRNIVGTSHNQSSTAVGHYLRQTGYTLREVNHNHPSGTPTPSGVVNADGTRTGDLRGAELYHQRNNKTILNIYTPQHGYTPYNKDGRTNP